MTDRSIKKKTPDKKSVLLHKYTDTYGGKLFHFSEKSFEKVGVVFYCLCIYYTAFFKKPCFWHDKRKIESMTKTYLLLFLSSRLFNTHFFRKSHFFRYRRKIAPVTKRKDAQMNERHTVKTRSGNGSTKKSCDIWIVLSDGGFRKRGFFSSCVLITVIKLLEKRSDIYPI